MNTRIDDSTLSALAAMIAIAVSPGCSRWSCYELAFIPQQPDEKWFIAVEVTTDDEGRHPAFGWVASELARGKTTGSRRGRWLVDDLWALSRERNVDPSAVRQPLFIVRGTPILMKPLDRCLVF